MHFYSFCPCSPVLLLLLPPPPLTPTPSDTALHSYSIPSLPCTPAPSSATAAAALHSFHRCHQALLLILLLQPRTPTPSSAAAPHTHSFCRRPALLLKLPHIPTSVATTLHSDSFQRPSLLLLLLPRTPTPLAAAAPHSYSFCRCPTTPTPPTTHSAEMKCGGAGVERKDERLGGRGEELGRKYGGEGGGVRDERGEVREDG